MIFRNFIQIKNICKMKFYIPCDSHFTANLELPLAETSHTVVKIPCNNWWLRTLRSSCVEMFYKKGAPENFAKISGKNLCQLHFNKVTGQQSINLQLYQKKKKKIHRPCVFLWILILKYFQQFFFYKTLPSDCFCTLEFGIWQSPIVEYQQTDISGLDI